MIARAPELSSVDEARRALVIQLAATRVAGMPLSTLEGGDIRVRDYANALVAAHMLTDRQGAGGVIASESEGGMSRSYDTSGIDDGDFGSTVYGREWLSLRRAYVFGPRIAGAA